MFNFKNLIKKYSKTPVYLLEQTEGHYDYSQGGIWVPGTVVEVEKQGVVLPLTNEDLKYDEGGTYSTQDKKLYTYNDFKIGSKIKHKDLEYTIQEKKDYADYVEGLNVYWCRRVGG